jgi:galactose mutarotase-like enzyme
MSQRQPRPSSPSSPGAVERPRSVTGVQWEIAHGGQRAIVTEIGATLRSYSIDGRPVIAGFAADEWAHAGRGQVLAPWPNRLGDGRYTFQGTESQAALDEPERNNAIHGLVRWLPWELEVKAQNLVALLCHVFPTPGYPYNLELRVEYRLGRDGLTIASLATNVGTQTLPFGLGFHPYLKPQSDVIDTALLRLPAHERLVLDERALPTGEVRAVEGTEYDFTQARPIGATQLDTAYTGLDRGGDRLAWSELSEPAGESATRLWMDEGFGYLMCYTGDTLGPADQRRAVAVEPMTCPPDAFRSERGLIILEPGQQWEGAWGMVAI